MFCKVIKVINFALTSIWHHEINILPNFDAMKVKLKNRLSIALLVACLPLFSGCYVTMLNREGCNPLTAYFTYTKAKISHCPSTPKCICPNSQQETERAPAAGDQCQCPSSCDLHHVTCVLETLFIIPDAVSHQHRCLPVPDINLNQLVFAEMEIALYSYGKGMTLDPSYIQTYPNAGVELHILYSIYRL